MAEIQGNRNMLLGYGATLLDSMGSDQISIGRAASSTYNAGSLTVGGGLTITGQLTLTGAGPGTTGQVLTSAGAAASPTWQTVAPGTLTGYTSLFTSLGLSTPTTPLALTVSGVAVGHNALSALTVAGTDNTAMGASAGAALTTGSGNTLIGSSAGATMTTGANNVVIGTDALNTTALNTNGNNNVIIGHDAARNNSTWTGSGCIIIGAGVSASGAIGAIGDNQVVLGLPSASLYIQGGLNLRFFPNTLIVSTTLALPLAQIYTASGNITITLPSVGPKETGHTVIFRRMGVANASIIIESSANQMVSDSGGVSSSVTLGTNKWQTMLVCNGVTWYQLFTS